MPRTRDTDINQSTDFTLFLKEFGANMKKTYDETSMLKYHQFVSLQYLLYNPRQRGLLIFHSMGTGKTILAASIAEACRKEKCINGQQEARKIIILAVKTLEANFKQTLEKIAPDAPLDKYKFVTLNAGNMFKQLARTDVDPIMEKTLGQFTRDVKSALEGSLLIVDEAHNLFNAICNGSRNAIGLYDTLLKTKDIKVLFLTGSPIVNSPFELVTCFNMIAGRRLFPEFKEDFVNYFIDETPNGLHIKNKQYFMNRILGLTSYYGTFYNAEEQRPNFPEQLPLIIEIVQMSPMQYEKYNIARDLEKAEFNKGMSSREIRFSSKGTASRTYRIKSRQLSDFVFPDHALREVLDEDGKTKKIVKHAELLTEADFERLDEIAPKMEKLLENVKSQQFPQLIYSEFVINSVEVMLRLFEHNGYTQWSEETSASVKGKTFAVLTGNIDIEIRSKIIQEFNSIENMHGEKIAILFISKVGAEGLDCKFIRAVHILEPFWHYGRIEQIIARGVRYKSHDDLPAEERNVQPYIYLATYPKDWAPSETAKLIKETKPVQKPENAYSDIVSQLPKWKYANIEETTDIEMLKHAIQNKILIDEFLLTLVETSCDCFAHHDDLSPAVQEKIHCRLCAPTRDKLYTDSIAQDLSMPDPCQLPAEEEITVHEVEGPRGEKFYYNIDQANGVDQIVLYEYNRKLGTYTRMRRTHPLYGILFSKVNDMI